MNSTSRRLQHLGDGRYVSCLTRGNTGKDRYIHGKDGPIMRSKYEHSRSYRASRKNEIGADK